MKKDEIEKLINEIESKISNLPYQLPKRLPEKDLSYYQDTKGLTGIGYGSDPENLKSKELGIHIYCLTQQDLERFKTAVGTLASDGKTKIYYEVTGIFRTC